MPRHAYQLLAVVAAIALTSTANTVLILLVSTSRLLYGVSKSEYRSFPTVFSRIHRTRQTPYLAVALVGGLTVPFVLIGDLGAVAGLANAALLIVFVLVNGALLKLRFDAPRVRVHCPAHCRTALDYRSLGACHISRASRHLSRKSDVDKGPFTDGSVREPTAPFFEFFDTLRSVAL